MSEYTTKLITEIGKELNEGEVSFDANDGIPWNFYVQANTDIEGKVYLANENAPMWKVSDLETVGKLTDDYLTKAREFYRTDNRHYNLPEQEFDKKLLFDLVVNETNYDWNNFEQYILMKTAMLWAKVRLGKIDLGAIDTPYGKVKVSAEISKNQSKLEGPHKFQVTLENELGRFVLPANTFGVVNGKVYLYTIQAPKEKQENILAKKMDRYFRKFNKGLDMTELEAQISTNALASLTAFATYMKENGAKEFFAPVYLPARYIAKEMSIKHNEKDEEQAIEKQKKLNQDQFNITNKFVYTIMRFAWHFDECELDFDDARQMVHFTQSDRPREKNDNEIYSFQKAIERNVKNLQISK